MGATLKEGLPLKLVKKHGDAVSTAVVRGYKSGGPSLNHLELVCKFYSVRVPDSLAIPSAILAYVDNSKNKQFIN